MITFLTAGESHGPKLTGIIEGIPAGFSLNIDAINHDLFRRQQGFGRGGRMKIENDQVKITAGYQNNLTTGAPLALEIANIDYKNWVDKSIDPMIIPRPGHADYVGAHKYEHEDLRISLERSSARETAMRTAIGSICKQLLQEFNIQILAYAIQIGAIKSDTQIATEELHRKWYDISLKNEFAFIDENKLAEIKEYINQVMKQKDTLGGVFEVAALNLPIGLGSYVHYHHRLDGQIAQAMMSIPAMKAVEIGNAIANSSLLGTKVHDEFKLNQDGGITRLSNRAGGLEGGVSNGMPVVTKVYMKPISTTLTPLQSIDLVNKNIASTVYERSDFCALPRAVVIGEAMMAFVIFNALAQKLGGDSKKAMLRHFDSIPKAHVDSFCLNNNQWRFNYADK